LLPTLKPNLLVKCTLITAIAQTQVPWNIVYLEKPTVYTYLMLRLILQNLNCRYHFNKSLPSVQLQAKRLAKSGNIACSHSAGRFRRDCVHFVPLAITVTARCYSNLLHNDVHQTSGRNGPRICQTRSFRRMTRLHGVTDRIVGQRHVEQ
jgi:hypothetical protein